MAATRIRPGLYRIRHRGITHVVSGTNAADAICTLIEVLK